MYLDPLTEFLRTLAKSNHYQTLYTFSKESPVWVFKNDRDLTSLQVEFLTYLSFYHSIQMDIYMGDIDDRVLDNFVYEDAYCAWRNAQRKKSHKPTNTPPPTPKMPPGTEIASRSNITWLFKSRPKERKD